MKNMFINHVKGQLYYRVEIQPFYYACPTCNNGNLMKGELSDEEQLQLQAHKELIKIQTEGYQQSKTRVKRQVTVCLSCVILRFCCTDFFRLFFRCYI